MHIGAVPGAPGGPGGEGTAPGRGTPVRGCDDYEHPQVQRLGVPCGIPVRPVPKIQPGEPSGRGALRSGTGPGAHGGGYGGPGQVSLSGKTGHLSENEPRGRQRGTAGTVCGDDPGQGPAGHDLRREKGGGGCAGAGPAPGPDRPGGPVPGGPVPRGLGAAVGSAPYRSRRASGAQRCDPPGFCQRPSLGHPLSGHP